MQIRVYYEDTDVGGVVYYANYLKFCERARSELFFRQGLMPYSEDGHFVVKSLHADYKGSAHFGDMLDVSVELRRLKAASLELYQEVKRGNEVLFRMEITLVHVSKDGQKVKKFTQTEKESVEKIFTRSALR